MKLTKFITWLFIIITCVVVATTLLVMLPDRGWQVVQIMHICMYGLVYPRVYYPTDKIGWLASILVNLSLLLS